MKHIQSIKTEVILCIFFKINYQATKTKVAEKAAVSFISDKYKTKSYLQSWTKATCNTSINKLQVCL